MNLKRFAWIATIVSSSSSLTLAQITTSEFVVDNYGVRCGAVLDAATTGSRVSLDVHKAIPGQPMALMLGSKSKSIAIPGSACRILTNASHVIPLIAGPTGRANLALGVLPKGATVFAQAIAFPKPARAKQLRANALVGTGGIRIRYASDAMNDVKELARYRNASLEVVFVEALAGEILLIVAGDTQHHRLALQRYNSGAMSAAALYTFFSGSSAPRELQRASAFAMQQHELARTRPDIAALRASSAPAGMPANSMVSGRSGSTSPSACNSAAWFEAMYCSSNGNYEACVTNTGGNPTYTRRVRSMNSRTASVHGTFTLRYSRWNGSSWYLAYPPITISSCQSAYINSGYSYWRKWRNMRITSGTGDLKHFRVSGYK